MLSDLTDLELAQLEKSQECCKNHSDDMCGIMHESDPCSGHDEAALLEGADEPGGFGGLL